MYLAANSGARVGLAQEVKERLQVEWNDPRDPSQVGAGMVAVSSLAAVGEQP